MLREVLKYTDTTNITNAFKVTIAAVLPVLLFYYLGHFQIGFAIALGVFLTYPSDIPSSLKHKINGVFVAAVMVAGSNLLINLIYPYPIIFYPSLVLIVFFLSIISVYGQRATMVSFSGLLSVSLAFSHLSTGMAMLEHAGLMFIGGLFYLFVSLLFYFISPYRYLELEIAQCIKLTSKYLKLRGDLWKPNAPRQRILQKQLILQVELNTIHQNLREIIFRNNASSGSSTQNRNLLIALVSLIEILELALSTSFDHSKLHEKFSENSTALAEYQNLAYSLSDTLKQLSKSLDNKTKYVVNDTLFENLEIVEKGILIYEEKLGKEAASDGVLILSNMRHYAEKQIEKVKTLERAITMTLKPQDIKGKGNDLQKFITPQYYPFSTILENLSFKSTIFRHSLRITITILIGLVLGHFLPFQNSYWILLTIVVIMRPGYGLTKMRSYERIYGTVLGGLIAFGVVSIIHNNLVLSILSIICMLLGFLFTQKNYKLGATFVTIYVVFVYVMLTPNIETVIQYRILDTVVGAGLAFIANYFFWPSWEFLSVRNFLEQSIKANSNYLKQISLFYNKKGEITTTYKLSRKEAFIEIGNLMNSYQRMSQEPKSKQKNIIQVYRLVELNHTLLTAAASLGTYIQTHPTTKASKTFNTVMNAVIKNLEFANIILITPQEENDKTLNEPNTDLELHFTELKKLRIKELQSNSELNEVEHQQKMQETQLVLEQLIWLTALSNKIIKATQNLNVA